MFCLLISFIDHGSAPMLEKAKLWNKFIGYAKICEDLTNINEKPEVITFVKNFFN